MKRKSYKNGQSYYHSPFYLRFIDDGIGVWRVDADPEVFQQQWAEFKSDMQQWYGLTWTFTEPSNTVDFMNLTIYQLWMARLKPPSLKKAKIYTCISLLTPHIQEESSLDSSLAKFSDFAVYAPIVGMQMPKSNSSSNASWNGAIRKMIYSRYLSEQK